MILAELPDTNYTEMSRLGGVDMYRSGANPQNDTVFRLRTNPAGTELTPIEFKGDGSAEFAGSVKASRGIFRNNNNEHVIVGEATLGSANYSAIQLKTDGSASFAGDVQVGGDPAGGANAGCDVRANGSLVIAGNSSGDSAITIYDAGNSSGKISLNADGSVEFAGGSCTVASSGRINIDRAEGQQYCFTTGYDGNTEQAHISGNGAIYSSYGLAVGGPGTTQGAGNAVINADGSAEFASMVSGANITGKNGQDFTPWYIVGSTSSGQQSRSRW